MSSVIAMVGVRRESSPDGYSKYSVPSGKEDISALAILVARVSLIFAFFFFFKKFVFSSLLPHIHGVFPT